MAKKVFGAIIALAVVVGVPLSVKMLTNNKVSLGYNQGYEPDQPLPFSHEVHAGQNKIDCKFCHTTTEQGRHASVPSLDICMQCHMNVLKPGEDGSPSPHIQKLQEKYYANEAIAWEKVHLLPDHVKFNHSAHINAGKQCQECHGPVETMSKVYQWADLSMGWCVNCHREPENNAPLNCGTCHY